MTATLVLLDHDRGRLSETALQAVAFAQSLEQGVDAVLIGGDAEPIASTLGPLGVERVHLIEHEYLSDFAPEAWGDALAQLVVISGATVVVATGTDRGNEVLAHLGAILDQPMVANVMTAETGDPWRLTRIRWGGSLFEHVELDAPFHLLTVAPHSWEPPEAASDVAAEIERFEPTLDETAIRTRVVDRVTLNAGITLATASVVVGGGRGVGSADGFEPLEELAAMLGGVVGCSRVVTNNGWRPHTDQVGQTGTRIAPDLYIACGISGAIQHWVGAMASKKILAINTDPEANMMSKADFAVVGDLREVVPALIEALR
jgi:electron transfer flavoprotein alpha subunit